MKSIVFLCLCLALVSCRTEKDPKSEAQNLSEVKIVGAMKDVMWKGELAGKIQLDTIADKMGLYGLGPESFLTGEILIDNGQTFVSRVTSDSTMTVQTLESTSAPFFVYTNVSEWQTLKLDDTIRTIQDLENLILEKSKAYDKPFTFKLKGNITNAVIHVQNLPVGAKVSSPKEAHQGQTNYELHDEHVRIVGFFSKDHQGVFTHHDSFVHMHLITEDEFKMGHLDHLEIDSMTLYLPVL